MENIGISNNTNEDITKYIKKLEEIILYTLKKHEANDAYVSVIFVNNKEIKNINKEYRNIDKETDVLSFALEDDTISVSNIRVLGDIIVSLDKVLEQSKLYEHSYEREFFFLVVHGLLHLLGYDHENKEDEIKMFSMQDEILKEFKIES